MKTTKIIQPHQLRKGHVMVVTQLNGPDKQLEVMDVTSLTPHLVSFWYNETINGQIYTRAGQVGRNTSITIAI